MLEIKMNELYWCLACSPAAVAMKANCKSCSGHTSSRSCEATKSCCQYQACVQNNVSNFSDLNTSVDICRQWVPCLESCVKRHVVVFQAFYQGLSAPAPEHLGSILTLAHFLDHMYHHRPAKRVEASPWYESATSLVQELITQTLRDAPKV